MDSQTESLESTQSRGDDPVCRTDPPVVVAVDMVPEAEEGTFRRCVAEAGCKLYEAEGRAGSFAVAGHPEQLGRLRHLMVPVKALRFVRENLEERLGDVASPAGLPHLTEELYKRNEVVDEIKVPKGTTLLVTRDFTFDAAHNLPRYNGKCERLHGHTFRLQVTVKAPLDTWSGMAFDFHDLKKTVQERAVRVLDHAYVNEIVPNPSAEFIAIWVWNRLSDLPLHEIKVWETGACHVTYHGPPQS